MSDELTPLLTASIAFAYVGGFTFVALGVYLSFRRRRLHPLLLVCISAIAISWIEAPYDWAMYAQFPPAIPRMPSWWPMNMTWGGLPASVPLGYIAYFVLPAVIGAALGQSVEREVRVAEADHAPERRPRRRLLWALLFNAILGARLGVFYYGRVIPGLALWEGTKHQYPLYDALAMGVQMMVFTYLLGRTDPDGPQRHRDVGRLEGEEPAPVVAAVGLGGRRRRARAVRARSSRPISSRSCGAR